MLEILKSKCYEQEVNPNKSLKMLAVNHSPKSWQTGPHCIEVASFYKSTHKDTMIWPDKDSENDHNVECDADNHIGIVENSKQQPIVF